MAHPRSAPLRPEDLGALRHRVRDTVIGPDDGEYDRARRIWNGMIDKHPAAIVRCRDSADVAAVVSFARETGVPVSVRGGGHNVAGNALCDGVVIDLSLMNGVRVDPDARRVHVQGGALLGDVDRETQRFGLAVPMGIMSRTVVAGLALHGGIGLLMRRFGLTSDNLRSAEVVTADGLARTASAGEHPDLFWALRGGGGNFGVVTSFEFQAYPVGPDVGGDGRVSAGERHPRDASVSRHHGTGARRARRLLLVLQRSRSREARGGTPERAMTEVARELAACRCRSRWASLRFPGNVRMTETPLVKVMNAISSRMPERLWRARNAADVRMGGQQNTKLLSA